MITRRKGITPVIAIVLLLLITVGAVGVVYTQFQGLVENSNGGDDLNKLQSADYSIVAATDSGGTIQLSIRNTGDSVYNLSESASLEVAKGGSYVDISQAPSDWTSADSNCLDTSQIGNNGNLETGSDYSCDTGVDFPGPGEDPVDFRLSIEGTAMTTKSCSVSTTDAEVC